MVLRDFNHLGGFCMVYIHYVVWFTWRIANTKYIVSRSSSLKLRHNVLVFVKLPRVALGFNLTSCYVSDTMELSGRFCSKGVCPALIATFA